MIRSARTQRALSDVSNALGNITSGIYDPGVSDDAVIGFTQPSGFSRLDLINERREFVNSAKDVT